MNNIFTKKKVRKPTGEIVYYTQEGTDKTYVRDKVGRTTGYCSNGSTFDKIGRRKAIGEQPGLLF